MNALRLTFREIRFQNRSFWRNPAAAFFTFAFPLMFLVIFNVIFGGGSYTGFGRVVKQATFFAPAIMAFSVVSACYTNIAMGTTFAREDGVLKRVRGTPLPPAAYLLGRIGESIFVSLILVVIVGAFGRIFYGVTLPTHTLPAFFAALAVGAASFCALGLAVTAAIPNADAAPAIVNASVLPILFISDVFIPLDKAPQWLGTVANLFPIRHLSSALLAAFNPFEKGSGFRGADLAVIAAWGLAGLVIAIRTFSWEPRG